MAISTNVMERVAPRLETAMQYERFSAFEDILKKKVDLGIFQIQLCKQTLNEVSYCKSWAASTIFSEFAAKKKLVSLLKTSETQPLFGTLSACKVFSMYKCPPPDQLKLIDLSLFPTSYFISGGYLGWRLLSEPPWIGTAILVGLIVAILIFPISVHIGSIYLAAFSLTLFSTLLMSWSATQRDANLLENCEILSSTQRLSPPQSEAPSDLSINESTREASATLLFDAEAVKAGQGDPAQSIS